MIFHPFVYFITLTCREGVLVEGYREDYDVQYWAFIEGSYIDLYCSEFLFGKYLLSLPRAGVSILHRQ